MWISPGTTIRYDDGRTRFHDRVRTDGCDFATYQTKPIYGNTFPFIIRLGQCPRVAAEEKKNILLRKMQILINNIYPDVVISRGVATDSFLSTLSSYPSSARSLSFNPNYQREIKF
jgi:hypothetical protein